MNGMNGSIHTKSQNSSAPSSFDPTMLVSLSMMSMLKCATSFVRNTSPPMAIRYNTRTIFFFSLYKEYKTPVKKKYRFTLYAAVAATAAETFADAPAAGEVVDESLTFAAAAAAAVVSWSYRSKPPTPSFSLTSSKMKYVTAS